MAREINSLALKMEFEAGNLLQSKMFSGRGVDAGGRRVCICKVCSEHSAFEVASARLRPMCHSEPPLPLRSLCSLDGSLFRQVSWALPIFSLYHSFAVVLGLG